jgi:hypothetical protein
MPDKLPQRSDRSVSGEFDDDAITFPVRLHPLPFPKSYERDPTGTLLASTFLGREFRPSAANISSIDQARMMSEEADIFTDLKQLNEHPANHRERRRSSFLHGCSCTHSDYSFEAIASFL